jgi:ribosomal protein S18 acetylase RimI-like enzyme
MAGVVGCVLEAKTVHLIWLAVEPRGRGLANKLVSEVERFAQAKGAGIVFAHAAQGSKLYQLLLGLGFSADAIEPDVISGRLAHSVDLLKVLASQ